MELAAHPWKSAHHVHAIAVGVPVRDHHGQIQLLRQSHLPGHYFLLERPGRVFLPIVVQADFTNGHCLRVGCQGFEGRKVRLVRAGTVLRVQSHSSIHNIIPLRQGNGRAGRVCGAAWINHGSYARLRQGLQHRIPIVVKALIVVMSVRIKKHWVSPPCLAHHVRAVWFPVHRGNRRKSAPFERTRKHSPS